MTNSAVPEIATRIYFVRGRRVMLDQDLAVLYEVETRTLNQAIRRNLGRFPDDFMFQLTDLDLENLRSQIVISSGGHGGRRYRPLAFTEHGVAMLASVLNSERAIQMNIAIMRAFFQLRGFLETNVELAEKFDQLEKKYDRQFKVVFDAIRELMTLSSTPRRNVKSISSK